MKVLVACEFSGIVRAAFEQKGHDAWSCDLLPTEKKGNHIQGNVLNILNNGWDLMIAHPPCTFLSNAGARHLFPNGQLNKERYKKGLESKKFFLHLLNAPIEKICVENPTPSSIFELPRSSHFVQPFEFGHKFSKKTLLWLKNLPPLMPNAIVQNQSTYIPSSTSKNKFTNKNKTKELTWQSTRDRNTFFEGVALAMADQWG